MKTVPSKTPNFPTTQIFPCQWLNILATALAQAANSTLHFTVSDGSFGSSNFWLLVHHKSTILVSRDRGRDISALQSVSFSVQKKTRTSKLPCRFLVAKRISPAASFIRDIFEVISRPQRMRNLNEAGRPMSFCGFASAYQLARESALQWCRVRVRTITRVSLHGGFNSGTTQPTFIKSD